MASGGAVLYITDAPSHLDFGIDCQSYETGPKFRGVSLIPPGLHMVYYSTGLGARQGFFFTCGGNELVVRSWDRATEEITPANVLSEESTRELEFALQRGLLNDQLGPYPFALHHTWRNLCNCISARVLERANCTVGNSVLPGDAVTLESLELKKMSAANSIKREEKLGVPRFANMELVEASVKEKLNKASAGDAASRARELTGLYMDKSAILFELSDQYFDHSWSDLLGEAQLAFLLFLLLFSETALEHWKALIHLVASSETAMKRHPQFAADFIRALHAQLNFAPTDFFDAELSRKNFLAPTFTALFSSLKAPSASGTEPLPEILAESVRRMLKFVGKKFHIFEAANAARPGAQGLAQDDEEFYNLIEEDMPVVVASIADSEQQHLHPAETLAAAAAAAAAGESGRGLLLESIQQKWSQYLPPATTNAAAAAAATATTTITADSKQPESTQADQAVSPLAAQNDLYRWRYPLLSDEMHASAGKEDIFMTAARVLDTECGDAIKREAEFFLQHEVAGRAR